MTSGPVVVQVLEGENAIAKNREVMGATNPANADEGTIRHDFGNRLKRIPFMVPTHRRPRPRKSLFSLQVRKSSADPIPACVLGQELKKAGLGPPF